MIKKFNVEKTKQLDKVNKFLALLYRKPICKTRTSMEEVRDILVIDFALMGDMVMDIPFLKTIRHNCPNAQITMVGMSWSEIILGDQGLVDDFIIFDGQNLLSSPQKMIKNLPTIIKVLRRINTKHYDIGFESKGDLRHIFFMHYTNCQRTVSYNYTGGEYLITDSFSPKPDTRHLIDEKLDLLELSGFTVFEEDRLPSLKVYGKYKQLVDSFVMENRLTDKKVIGIHPGASNVNKQYRFYSQLIEKLESELALNTVYAVFEGPGEADICDVVCNQLKDMNRLHMRIRRKTKEYVALVSICNYMICNDSAAGHIASAYGIPAIVIFGPVKPETALPRGINIIKYVSHDMECKPCTLPVCPKRSEECIKTITVDEVYEKIKEAGMLENVL